MDVKRIGEFLAQLRKEQGMTQEQLGEKLGVTNKTVSRWENGNYLPPVEILEMLSDMYALTINEIISGQRLMETEYKTKAEENIKCALESSFTLKEKIEFYKKKWLKEHMSGNVLLVIALCGLLLLGIKLNSILLIAMYPILAVVVYGFRRNQMMVYVEDRAFDGSGRQ